MSSSALLLNQALQEMLEFGSRPLIQVSGEPVNSIKAMYSSFESAPGGEASPNGTSWAKMLKASLASDSNRTFKNDVYASGLSLEQRMWVGAQEKERAHARKRWLGDTPKTEEARLWVENIDASVLSALCAGGFLTINPSVQEGSDALHASGASAQSRPGARPHIVMLSDERGQVPQHMKLNLVEEEAVYARWFVLLHEAAHCEFKNLRNPFAPNDGSLSPQEIQAFNDWVFRPFSGAHAHHYTLLNECFADCYAAMMLLEATDFNPLAAKVVAINHGRRAFVRTEAENEVADTEEFLSKAGLHEMDGVSGGRASWPRGKLPDVHLTDLAINKLMSNVKAWRGQPPSVLRSMAQTYASEGFMELFDANRLSDSGKPSGAILREGLQSPQVDDASLSSHYTSMLCAVVQCSLYGDFESGLDWLRHQMSNHPALPFVEEVWTAVGPEVLGRVQALPFDLVAGLNHMKPAAEAQRQNLTETTVKQYLKDNPELPSLQTAETARAAGQKFIADALAFQGPQAGALELRIWRTRRSPSSGAGLPSQATAAPPVK